MIFFKYGILKENIFYYSFLVSSRLLLKSKINYKHLPKPSLFLILKIKTTNPSKYEN